MSKGRCKKGFPRAMIDKTDTSIEGYPNYRRRVKIKKTSRFEMPVKKKVITKTDENTGKKKISIHKIDPQWLPGYNGPLLMKYRLHTNVECCQGMSSIAYVLNYIHKGSDVAYVEFKQYAKDVKNDEIKMYKYGRVMTADEAHWNISSFGISEIKPPVKVLSFFEPDSKRVTVRQGDLVDIEQAEELQKETEWYQFFERNKKEKEIQEEYEEMKRNKVNPEVVVDTINKKLGYEMLYVKNEKVKRLFDYERQETELEKEIRKIDKSPRPRLPWSFELLYTDFGKRYLFDRKSKSWKRQKKLSTRVTRLPLRYPGNEYFYLRLLLKHRKGMTNVDDLYNDPDGNKCPSFKLACLSHDLIDDSTEYFTAMAEAKLLGSFGLQLLYFYACIIAEGDATNIREMWDGVGLEEKRNKLKKKNKTLSEEEENYINGFKKHMIVVPPPLIKKGYSKDWTKLPSEHLKYECEQYTLRKLAHYLEHNGQDLPPELPPLDKSNKYALNAEWIAAHETDPDQAERDFEKNIASILI